MYILYNSNGRAARTFYLVALKFTRLADACGDMLELEVEQVRGKRN